MRTRMLAFVSLVIAACNGGSGNPDVSNTDASTGMDTTDVVLAHPMELVGTWFHPLLMGDGISLALNADGTATYARDRTIGTCCCGGVPYGADQMGSAQGTWGVPMPGVVRVTMGPCTEPPPTECRGVCILVPSNGTFTYYFTMMTGTDLHISTDPSGGTVDAGRGSGDYVKQ